MRLCQVDFIFLELFWTNMQRGRLAVSRLLGLLPEEEEEDKCLGEKLRPDYNW